MLVGMSQTAPESKRKNNQEYMPQTKARNVAQQSLTHHKSGCIWNELQRVAVASDLRKTATVGACSHEVATSRADLYLTNLDWRHASIASPNNDVKAWRRSHYDAVVVRARELRSCCDLDICKTSTS